MMTVVIEQFKQKLNKENDPQLKIDLMVDFVNDFMDSSLNYCVELSKAIVKLSRKINNSEGLLMGELLLSYLKSHNNIQQNVDENIKAASNIRGKVKDITSIARADGFLSFLYWYKGEYDTAFDIAFHALSIAENSNLPKAKGWLHCTLGVFYFDLKDYSNSREQYLLAKREFKLINHSYGIARCKTGLASIHIGESNPKEAVKLLEEIMWVYEGTEHYPGLSRTYNDLGMAFVQLNKTDEALIYLEKSLEVRLKIQHYQGLISTYTELGELQIKRKNYPEAILHLQDAIKLAEKLNAKPKLYRIHFLFSQVYKLQGKPWEALQHFEQYNEIKSEVIGEQASNKLKRLQAGFEKDSSEKEAEINRLRNVELANAYIHIEAKNKEILDSINYAKRLQEAILPAHHLVREYLSQSFILFKPRDIVAGDFYWMYAPGGLNEDETKAEDLIILAVADCTGHGVPGAMVSVVCSNALNSAVKESNLRDPGDILNKVRELIVETFRANDDLVMDGMDISLCCLDLNSKSMKWAGANNPLWIIRQKEGVPHFKEYKPDRQPIGSYHNARPFTSHTIQLHSHDCIYLFSDGFADQFGGAFDKKFRNENLKNLFLSVCSLPMEKQRELINEAFEMWRGDAEQVDDVCLIGVRV